MATSNSEVCAVVTGAGKATGIGFEVCRQLAQAGMQVVLTARKAADAEARAAALQNDGLSVSADVVDVTDEASVAALAERVKARFGHVNVVVNNAAMTNAFGERPSTADLSVARRSLETTLLGSWRVTQAFIPLLKGSVSPRVVNVSSGAGSHGDPVFGLTSGNAMGPSYAAAKAALNALTVTLALELRADKILVNAVCPGFTATFPGGAEMGARPVSEGAASVVWAALVDDGGPSGGFFRDGQPLPW